MPWLLMVLATTGASCGVKATGVEECRAIETARCQSGAVCGIIPDAEACERYVVEHCRHGFAQDLGPSKRQVERCTAAISAVGQCADRQGRRTAPSACRESSVKPASARQVCELVERPERLPDCSFLSTGDDAEPDAGAAAGDESTLESSTESPTAAPTADAGADAGGG